MTQIARDLWDKKQKPRDLNQKHIQETYSELIKAARKGYGKDWTKLNNETGEPDPAALKMRQNLYRFSQVKDYAMLVELNNKLTEGGKVKNWENFRKDALSLNKRYNQNYLQAEWQTARQSGHHANNWKEYERNKERYPNLKYTTQGDGQVRPEHASLNGIIRPVGHSFWDVYYPANGFRCRCYVEQTSESANDRQAPENAIKPEFHVNVGKTGQVFAQKPAKGGIPHPYFALAKEGNLEQKFNRKHYKYLENYSRKKLKGKTVSHSEIDKPIEFNTAGIKEAFNQPHKQYNEKNILIPYIDSILPKSKYIGAIDDIKNNPFILRVHIFEMKIEDAINYIIVRENKGGEFVFYSITDNKTIKDRAKK